MQDKTLFLHAGGPKAGSSALQVFFYLNAERLRELGFSYRKLGLPVTHDYEITAGNGVDLCSVLSSNHVSETVWRSEIREALMSHFVDDIPRAICSSENFTLLAQERWLELRQVAEQEGVALVVCYYVRNVCELFRAAYDQALRHGYDLTWGAFLANLTGWEHFEALRRLDETFDNESLRVLSYDQCKKRLAESFLEILGVSEIFDREAIDRGNGRIVNRSLTNTERDILRNINLNCPGRLSAIVSGVLMDANRTARPEPIPFEEDDLRRLEEEFGPQVRWINDRFFAGKNVVNVMEPGANSQAMPSQSSEEKVIAYKALFDLFLGEIRDGRSIATKEIATKLMNIDWENASDPNIPIDFDPIGYLLCNMDLMIADVRPYRHYLDFGAKERRGWKLADVAQ